VKRAHLRPDGSAPAPMMRIGLLCRSSHLPAIIKQARTHARSAAAVANAQVHQPQGAPGTHHRPDGSTPAPISLIWLPPRLRVTLGGSTPAPISLIWLPSRRRFLPEAISHTHAHAHNTHTHKQHTHTTHTQHTHTHTRSAAAVDNAQVPGTLVTPGGSSPVLMHALSAPASTR